tara:strand:+ start:197 stop:406 length:210 start_codon:yes stop_codon:yes gene_type:complete
VISNETKTQANKKEYPSPPQSNQKKPYDQKKPNKQCLCFEQLPGSPTLSPLDRSWRRVLPPLPFNGDPT